MGIIHFVTTICSMLCCFELTIGIGICGIVLLFYIFLSLYLICGLYFMYRKFDGIIFYVGGWVWLLGLLWLCWV